MQGLAPQYLSDLLEPYSPLLSLQYASKLLLNSPSFNLKTYGYKSFSVCSFIRLNDAFRKTLLKAAKKTLRQSTMRAEFSLIWALISN